MTRVFALLDYLAYINMTIQLLISDCQTIGSQGRQFEVSDISLFSVTESTENSAFKTNILKITLLIPLIWACAQSFGAMRTYLTKTSAQGIRGISKRKIVLNIFFFWRVNFFILITFHNNDMPKCLRREIKFLQTFINILTCLFYFGVKLKRFFAPHSMPVLIKTVFVNFSQSAMWVMRFIRVSMRVFPAKGNTLKKRKYAYASQGHRNSWMIRASRNTADIWTCMLAHEVRTWSCSNFHGVAGTCSTLGQVLRTRSAKKLWTFYALWISSPIFPTKHVSS